MEDISNVLRLCMPHITEKRVLQFAKPLAEAMAHYAINTDLRKAAFLAQVGHESGSLSVLTENLNYSPQRLLQIFPNYFNAKTAMDYGYKPAMIASKVYANRMGNGDEESQEGWTYRGRGPIQTTGKNKYKLLSKELVYDFISKPDDMSLPGAGSMSSGWFWFTNHLNEIADTGDIIRISAGVNLGDPNSKHRINGIDDRILRFALCKKAFNIPL